MAPALPKVPVPAPVVPRAQPKFTPIPSPPQVQLPRTAPVVSSPLNGRSDGALVWDATHKEYQAKPGDIEHLFQFGLTNVSSGAIFIRSVRTSCGCTVPKLPRLPWRIGSGESAELEVLFNFRGKHGTIQKLVTVDTSAGRSLLNVKVVAPELTGDANRARNVLIASVDRQIVFKGSCATCHAAPTVGKQSEALYTAACAICHDAPHRASMVPDLRAPDRPNHAEYWREWITNGREGSLMPAFARAHGGPLDEQQIESLVQYLTTDFQTAGQESVGFHPEPDSN